MAIGFGIVAGTATTDRLNTGLIGDSPQRTWAFRVNLRNASSGGGFPRIFSSQTNEVIITLQSGQFSFGRQWTNGIATWFLGAANSALINTDYSIVISYDQSLTSANPTAFINGISASITNPSARTGNAISSGGNAFHIGNRPSDNARNWDGIISSAAIWDEIIPAEMALAISGSYSPLIYTRNLVYYNPMVVTTSQDIIGARTQTVTGARNASHPPVLLELGGSWN